MASRELVLGLSISDRTVQAVEVEQDGPSNTLLAIDEWENTLPVGGAMMATGWDSSPNISPRS